MKSKYANNVLNEKQEGMMFKRCGYITTGILLIVFGVSSIVFAGYPQTITTSNPLINLPRPDGDPRWKEAFSSWDKRDDTKEIEKAVKIFDELATQNPNDPVALLWKMRSNYGLGMRQKGEEQKATMFKATKAGEDALKIDPDNDALKFWRFATIMLSRNFTDKEYEEARKLGLKFEKYRELVVPDNDPMWQEMLTHWDKRLTYAEGMKAIEILHKLDKKYPDKFDTKVWLCRVYYWMHFVEDSSDNKAKQLEIAMEWGNKAAEMEPLNAGANFFLAAAMGQYGNHTSFINYVRYSPDIVKRLMKVMEEDPNFFYGGVSQYFSLATAKAPTVVTSAMKLVGFPDDFLERSSIYASKYEPRYLRNDYSLGEMYYSLGKKDLAKKHLEKVINSDPSELKNMEPENIVAQKLAQTFLDKHYK